MASSKVKDSKKQSNENKSFLVQSYLLLYNGIQTLGWSYMLFQFLTSYVLGNSSKSQLYETIKYTVIIFQNLALLEVVNAALGLVKSNALITFVQIMSRVILVCGILMPIHTSRESFGFPLMITAWSVTEIIRYAFYFSNLIGSQPYILLWLRYSTFIILYPIGITGELLCLYCGQTYAKQTELWSYALPNTLNFTFSYQYFLCLIMLTYIPIFPQLYLHMFSQRRKMLVTSQQDKSKTK